MTRKSMSLPNTLQIIFDSKVYQAFCIILRTIQARMVLTWSFLIQHSQNAQLNVLS